MALFVYRAKKGPDDFQEGEIEAAVRQEAIIKLNALGLFPVYVEEKKQIKQNKPSKVSLKQKVEFTHQLATLINTGTPLVNALSILSVYTKQEHFKPVLLDVIAQVKEGVEFSQALSKYSSVFSDLYVSLVRVGEASGKLGESLGHIAELLEEELEFRSNLIAIFTYPCFIFAVGVLTVVVLLNFVIPKLVTIFEDLGQNLPAPTLILMALSKFFTQYWFLVLAFVIAVIMYVKRQFKKESVKYNWGKLQLKVPLLGKTIEKISIATFSKVLAVLLKNGLPIDMALRVVSETVTNLFIRSQIMKVEGKIKEGFALSEMIQKISFFPATFVNMVKVGEESGTLENVLATLAVDYNKEVAREMKTLMSVIEPLLIIGLGIIVGFVVLAMLLPIFQIDFNF